MGTNNFYGRLMRTIAGGGGLNAGDTSDDVLTTPSSSGPRVAAGTGTLVTGTVTIATGLATVTAFTATINGTGATATGATEVERLTVSSITTGAVVVAGSYHSGTAAVEVPSASGTATFYWIAFGT